MSDMESNWGLQVDCSGVERSPIEAPKGCTQYYLGANGVVKSFNFEGVQYLTNHNYRDVELSFYIFCVNHLYYV